MLATVAAFNTDHPQLVSRPRCTRAEPHELLAEPQLLVAEPHHLVVEPPEVIDDDNKNLHVRIYRKFLADESQCWWQAITANCRWHRVKYSSARFGKSCETPCYTAFFGGFPEFAPYAPVPLWLQPLVTRVSEAFGVPFNALLLRLYFDGHDEIAWHTDGRTFLGPTPTIGSLSLGATAQFEMRRMRNVWPNVGGTSSGAPYDDGIDRETPVRSWHLRDGDLLVMHGDTQAHWHHRVPKAKSRRPRININFRYIIPGTDDAERGQATYYKYMRDGDGPELQGMAYDEILRRSGSLLTNLSCIPPAAKGGAATGDAAEEGLRIHSAEAQTATAALSIKTRPAADHQAEWACPQCTLLNPAPAPVCGLCDYKVPSNATLLERLASEPKRAEQEPAAKRLKSQQQTLEGMWRSSLA